MSHFTEVETKITNIEMLKEALKNLDIEFVDTGSNLTISNFYEDKTDVALKIPTGHKYDIGVRQTENDQFEMIADWELLEKLSFDCEGFQNKILQKYSYLTVKEQMAEQGFDVEEESIDENGNINLVVTQW